MPHPPTAGLFTRKSSPGLLAVVSTSFGFLAGAVLGTGFLLLDSFGLRALMVTSEQPLMAVGLFVLGFATLLSPVGFATAFSAAAPQEKEHGSRQVAHSALRRESPERRR